MTRTITFAAAIVILASFAATASAAIMEIGIGEFEDPSTLDFESVASPPTVVASDDPVFTSFGITSATAVRNSDSGDQISTGFTGNALFVENGSDNLIVIQDSTTTFALPDSFTFDLGAAHRQFGLSFSDAAARDFDIEFFRFGQSVGSIVFSYGPTGDTSIFGFESEDGFDRIVLTQFDGNDPFGVDNLTLGARIIPEPSSFFLLGLGALVVARRTCQRRGERV